MQISIKKRSFNITVNNLYLVFTLFLFLMPVISGIFGRERLIHSLLFFIFEVFVILIPGMFFASFFECEGMTDLERLMLSYLSGYTVSIVFYSVMKLINGNETFIRLITCLYAFVLCYFCMRRKGFNIPDAQIARSERVIVFSVLFLVFCAKLILFELSELPPVYAEQSFLHHDFFYWLDDVVACKRGMPPMNLRTVRDNYHYHYLGAAQIAYISQFTGASAFHAIAVYSFIQPAILMVLSASCVIFRLICFLPARIFTLITLFFTTGREVYTAVTYRGHILSMPMTFDISYGLFMGIFWLILSQIKKEKISFTNNLYFAILVAITTGIKGPTGALALGGVGLLYLYDMFKNRNIIGSILNGVITVGLFAGVYALVLSGRIDSYMLKNDSTSVIATDSNENNNINSGEYEVSDDKNSLIEVLEKLKAYGKYVYNLNPLIVILCIFYIALTFLGKRKPDYEIIIFIVVVIGTSMGYFIKMVGNSQMYFTLNAIFLIFILAGRVLDYFADYINKLLYGTVVAVILLFAVFSSVWSDFENVTYLGLLNAGNIMERIAESKQIDYQGIFTNDYMVTNNEYDAYSWVRNHTDEETVILSDLGLIEKEGNRNDIDNYIVPAITERISYRYKSSEEKSTVDNIFSGNLALVDELKMKINYIIVHKNEHPLFKAGATEAAIVYENAEIAVWGL